jgi:hypothetical protein
VRTLSGLDSQTLKTQPACAVSLLTLLPGSVALVFSLLLWISNASAAPVVFAGHAPHNNPAAVGCYPFHYWYWQPDWDITTKVNVGRKTRLPDCQIYTLITWKPG